MDELTNSAKRISFLVDKLMQQNPSIRVAEAWAKVLGIEWNVENPDIHKVQAQLNKVREEVELLETQMAATDFEPKLYSPYLEQIKQVVFPTNLDTTWENYRGRVGPDTKLALMWCGAVLPDEEEISAQELQDILQKIFELKNEIDSLKLSLVVRDFILRQLDIIEKALHEYPIRGGKAINRGLNDVWSVYANAAGEPKTDEEKKEVSKLNAVISMVGKVADGVIKADKVASAAVHIANTGKTAIVALTEVMNNLPALGQ